MNTYRVPLLREWVLTMCVMVLVVNVAPHIAWAGAPYAAGLIAVVVERMGFMAGRTRAT